MFNSFRLESMIGKIKYLIKTLFKKFSKEV